MAYTIISRSRERTDITTAIEPIRFAEAYNNHIIQYGVGEDVRVYESRELSREEIQNLILLGDMG